MRKAWHWLALFLGILALSWGGPLIRLTSAPALTVAAWRLIFSATVFLPLGLRGWHGKGVRYAVLAGFFLAAHFAFWIQSLRLTSVASSVVLVNTNPLFVGVFSWLFGECLGRAFWLGVLLSLAGTVLIGYGDLVVAHTALLGDLLALLGAVAASGYLLLGRRARQGMATFPYVSLTYSVAALCLLAIAVALRTPLPPKTDWQWLLLIALIPQVIGHTTVNWALRRFPAAAVAVAILSEPVGAGLWAFFLFGEGIQPLQGVGMALVLLGIFWSLRSVRL
ncbi:MAG: DMT family transporter [Candidatus Bipolaricaulota bacterium]|nr:DMT family transporter [Candidatus Bipolaricaulota bacterium]MDW8126677.1 DMT family transporter [Candidatus Bipolaricaulota bacterium]